MESIDSCRIIRYNIYIILASVTVTAGFIVILTSVPVAACVDRAIQSGNFDGCGWEIIQIFTASLCIFLPLSIFLFRRATKLDRALVVAVTGIATCLFLEYTAGLVGYGNLALLFTLALGYMISGRERWKITWEPRKQFFVLFSVVILSISLYTLGPDYITVPASLFDHEYLKLDGPLLMRFVGEMCILVAVMHFGKGALKWILAATR